MEPQTEMAISFDGEIVGSCAKMHQKEHSLSFSLRISTCFYEFTIKSYGQFGLAKFRAGPNFENILLFRIRLGILVGAFSEKKK